MSVQWPSFGAPNSPRSSLFAHCPLLPLQPLTTTRDRKQPMQPPPGLSESFAGLDGWTISLLRDTDDVCLRLERDEATIRHIRHDMERMLGILDPDSDDTFQHNSFDGGDATAPTGKKKRKKKKKKSKVTAKDDGRLTVEFAGDKNSEVGTSNEGELKTNEETAQHKKKEELDCAATRDSEAYQPRNALKWEQIVQEKRIEEPPKQQHQQVTPPRPNQPASESPQSPAYLPKLPSGGAKSNRSSSSIYFDARSEPDEVDTDHGAASDETDTDQEPAPMQTDDDVGILPRVGRQVVEFMGWQNLWGAPAKPWTREKMYDG